MPVGKNKVPMSVPFEKRQVEMLRKLSAVTRVPQAVYLRDWVQAGLEWACQQSFGLSFKDAEMSRELDLYKRWIKSIKSQRKFFGGSAKNLKDSKSEKTQ